MADLLLLNNYPNLGKTQHVQKIICGTKCAIGNAGLHLIDYSSYTSRDMILFQLKCLLMNSKVVPKLPHTGFYLSYCSTVSHHLAAQSSRSTAGGK